MCQSEVGRPEAADAVEPIVDPKARLKQELKDTRRPMVFRVGMLGDEYNSWVVGAKPMGSLRLFASDAMETHLTRMPPWIVPVIWIPAMLHCCIESLGPNFGPAMLVWWAFFCAGVTVWAFIEYVLHRWVFHCETEGYWSNTAHFLLHGIHHLSPTDPDRLVRRQRPHTHTLPALCARPRASQCVPL